MPGRACGQTSQTSAEAVSNNQYARRRTGDRIGAIWRLQVAWSASGRRTEIPPCRARRARVIGPCPRESVAGLTCCANVSYVMFGRKRMELVGVSDERMTAEADEASAGAEADGPFPSEVEFLISALEAGPKPAVERQKLKRSVYRVRATVKLFSDDPDAPPVMLYTRHVNSQAVGFLASQHLPLSHGGILKVRSPQGEMLDIYATVLRCREVAPGWYEGALYFNREQPAFTAEEME